MSSNGIQILSSDRSRDTAISRRGALAALGGVAITPFLPSQPILAAPLQTLPSAVNDAKSMPKSKLKFGLVTYLWGKDMDLPTVIASCEEAGMAGVELRTEHRHQVEPEISKPDRESVRKRFVDSNITLIGYGSNCEFHSNNPDVVAKNIARCKEYIHLMHDCGGSGVKVKPNGFVDGIEHRKTIEQIGLALRELAVYGKNFGQQIRLEVHGAKTCELHVIRDIMQVADHDNAVVCWNSNAEDLLPPGLAENFAMVKNKLGDTTHVRELDTPNYPFDQLFRLLIEADYAGWVLLEAHSDPKEKVPAMKAQRAIFDKLAAQAS